MNTQPQAQQPRVHFFPVRHHSPSCAYHLRRKAEELMPAAILIEGPSDFNSHIQELYLEHALPIAIYSYVANEDYQLSAYHPFCEYSPEWQALQMAKALNCDVEFIDLPWETMSRWQVSDSDAKPSTAHRYADPEFRKSLYIKKLCEQFGVDDFDALWDELFEVDLTSDTDEFIARVKEFCGRVRSFDDEAADREDALNHARECFMADRIEVWLQKTNGPLLVVTGGYHTSGLIALIEKSHIEIQEPEVIHWEDYGNALTPYSYERLDGLTGYEAGMPGPNFYHDVWESLINKQPFDPNGLLDKVSRALRHRKLVFSTADRIAAQAHIAGLATIRGHSVPWRLDLIDGLSSTAIKDEIAVGGYHPMHDIIHEVFRGVRQGHLDSATRLPPLTKDIASLLHEFDLVPGRVSRKVTLDLFDSKDRLRSQCLHRLKLLNIHGFTLLEGPDMVARESLVEASEIWQIRWTPEFDSSKIEASKYGASLEEASNQRLVSLLKEQPSLSEAAELLIEAALCGLGKHADDMYRELFAHVDQCGEFLTIVDTFSHVTYLKKYDDILDFPGVESLEPLIEKVYVRTLWLLDSLGQPAENLVAYVDGIHAILKSFSALHNVMHWDSGALVSVLKNVCCHSTQAPQIRGAALGALVMLTDYPQSDIQSLMLSLHSPVDMGDFLSGLFQIAREKIQRHSDLIQAIDHRIGEYDEQTFLEALPSLRLAFSFFTPREKMYLTGQLFPSDAKVNQSSEEGFHPTVGDIEEAVRLEAQIISSAKAYGIALTEERKLSE